MRYRIAALLLFAVLPVLNVLAAPAPNPSAILDIGPPPKGETAKGHCKTEIDSLTFPYGIVNSAWHDPEVRKLPSVSPLWKDAGPWLVKNIRVTEEAGGRRVRLTFRAGTCYEQATILNALLRAYIRVSKEREKFYEDGLNFYENCILDLEKRIASGQYPNLVDSYRKGINDLRTIHIPSRRAEIARYTQIAVIKWAK